MTMPSLPVKSYSIQLPVDPTCGLPNDVFTLCGKAIRNLLYFWKRLLTAKHKTQFTMVNITGRLILTVLLGAVLFTYGRAQNYVPNPSFETVTECPSNTSQVPLATPWISTTAASPDLFNECGSGPVTVPFNFVGFQQAHTGRGYAGIVHVYNDPPNYREYITARLTEPLVGGVYEVGFYISLADFYKCGTTEFGAYFSTSVPTSPLNYTGILELTPQFKPPVPFITNISDWTLLSGCVLLPPGIEYITIGNFSALLDTKVDPLCYSPTNPNPGISYYYIDDVYVVKSAFESNVIDLGGPIIACDEYLIDPGLTGSTYTWSNGTHFPTLTVTESGTYGVTVSNGCSVAMGEIEVTIIEDVAVEAGPEEVNICDGESYTISLDPPGYEYVWQDGSTDSEYTVSQSGEYFVTMDDGCHTSTDSITVNVIIPPEPFVLSATGILCDGEEFIYNFDPSIGDFQWQDGSDDAYYVIDHPGEYSLTISNMCGEETSSVEVEGMEAPDVYLGPDTIILCDGGFYEIELYHDPAIHTVLWLDSTQAWSYQIDSAGHYGVTVSNFCGEATAVIDAVEMLTPNFTLGNDSLICASTGLVLTPGDFPGATYLWQDSSTLDSFIALTPGEYAVTVTNVCGTTSDSIDLNFQNLVTQPDLGPDASLCPGETLTIQLNDPNASYLWQDGSTSATYTINASGQYIVTASNACSSLSDTLNITLNNNPPTVTLPADISLCQGQSITLDAGVGGVDYLWSDNSTGASITVNAPGTYSITVSNTCGADSDDINIIDGGPAPAVNLGADLAICPGESVDLAPAFSNVDTWLWNTGETTSTIAITTAGQTSVIVSNGCGTEYDTLITTLLPAVPVFSLGNDTAVCANEIVTLSVNVSNVNIVWSDGSTNTSLAVSNPGQYYATISNSCGDYADTMNITQLAAVPALDLGNDQSLCPGELIVIDPGIANVDYLWHDGSTGTTFSTTQAASVSLTISNECGSSTDNLEVIESTEGPQVDLGADVTGCVGENITINSGISGVDYEWQDGSTNPSFSTNVSGEYWVAVSNSCGTDADTIVVDLSGLPPVADLGNDLSLCDGEEIVLEANAPAGTTILWQDGSTGQTFTVTGSGTVTLELSNECGDVSDVIEVDYTSPPAAFSLGIDTTICDGESVALEVIVQPGTDLLWSDGSSSPVLSVQDAGTYSATLSNECGEETDAIAVSVTQAPEPVEIGNDTVLCAGQSITLTAPVTTNAFEWQDGSSASVMIADESQIYSLQVSNECGIEEDAFEVFLIVDEPAIDFPQPLLLCPNDTITLSALQVFPAQYVWSTGETTAAIDIITPGTYAVTVITECFEVEQKVVITGATDCEPPTKFYVPNIFSPNGDGLNDFFDVHVNSEAVIEGMSGTIYDRWGSIIFDSKDNPFTWDGRQDGENLNPAVYVYVIKVAYTRAGVTREEVLVGDVTLLK